MRWKEREETLDHMLVRGVDVPTPVLIVVRREEHIHSLFVNPSSLSDPGCSIHVSLNCSQSRHAHVLNDR